MYLNVLKIMKFLSDKISVKLMNSRRDFEWQIKTCNW